MQTRSKPPCGFTLLELLVVVAVISLLLAMLLPALSAATEAGRSAVCASNLRQLGVGVYAYAEANDDRLPWFGNHRPDGYEWWVTQVAGGMQAFEPRIYACPSDPVPLQLWLYVIKGNVYMGDRGYHSGLPRRARDRRRLKLRMTYRGFCDTLERAPAGRDPQISRTVTSWHHPDQSMLMIEAYPFPNYIPKSTFTQRTCFHVEMLDLLVKGSINPTWDRHFGATNVLFHDGHVTILGPTDLGAVAKSQQFRMPS